MTHLGPGYNQESYSNAGSVTEEVITIRYLREAAAIVVVLRYLSISAAPEQVFLPQRGEFGVAIREALPATSIRTARMALGRQPY
jgi:hypothetical protein